MNFESLTAAVCLTGPDRAAIAVVAVEGGEAWAAISRYFLQAKPRPIPPPIDIITFGHWKTPQGEEVVLCRTAENRFELHCHGGTAVTGMLLDDLANADCRVMGWDEWIRQDASDPLAAEARVRLAECLTQKSAAMLLDQSRGCLTQAIRTLQDHLSSGANDTARQLVETLLARGSCGLHLVEPWKVALCGAPNAGKSSLVNALLGFERCIVHETPGTTRDVVASVTAIEGWPCRLEDTAGIRQADESVEAMGVARAMDQLRTADLALFIVDRSRPFSEEDADIQARLPETALVVHTKTDLPKFDDLRRPPGIQTSVCEGTGLEALQRAIISRLVTVTWSPGDAVPFTRSQIASLDAILESLGERDLSRAKLETQRMLCAEPSSDVSESHPPGALPNWSTANEV